MDFDSYLEKIKTHLESHGVYIMFLEGDYNLGCPPFGCNFEESVQATIPPSQVSRVGYERIIIYRSHIGWVAGVCLENISEWKYASLQERRMFYGIVILSIEKKGNMCYLNMLM